MLKSRMFVCTAHKSWKCAQNFFLQTLQTENFQNASQLHGKQLRFWMHNREHAPRTYSVNLASGVLQNASELHGKKLHFPTHKLWNCVQNVFCKSCRRRTSTIRLFFTANSFVFGRINREIVPKTFSINLAGGELPQCVWTSRQTVSFLDA